MFLLNLKVIEKCFPNSFSGDDHNWDEGDNIKGVEVWGRVALFRATVADQKFVILLFLAACNSVIRVVCATSRDLGPTL